MFGTASPPWLAFKMTAMFKCEYVKNVMERAALLVAGVERTVMM